MDQIPPRSINGDPPNPPNVSEEEFGKYRLLHLIGRGGMGAVWCAEDTTLGRMIALKILHSNFTGDEVFVRKFKEEARHVASLSHPNIVRIHSFDQIHGRYAIDMEYIDGCSLAQLLTGEVATPARVLSLLGGVVHALAACHDLGVVHRDVKPQNILIDHNSRGVLTDFGIATAYAEQVANNITDSVSTTLFVGTPRYAPPEAWDNAVPSPQWDVFSLAVVIYECLTARHLFEGTTPLQIVRSMVLRRQQNLLDDLPDLSSEFRALLADMIEEDPAKRPPHAGEVLDRMKQLPEWDESASDTVATQMWRVPPHLRRQATRTSRKPVVSTLALAGMLLMLLTGAALYYLFVLINAPAPSLPEPLGPRTYHARPLQDNDTSAPTWEVLVLPGEQQDTALLFNENAVGLVRLSRHDPEEVSVQGHLAEYLQPMGQGFREAEISGKARVAGGDKYLLSLALHAPATREQWTWTGTLDPAPNRSAEHFRAQAAEADAVQPLLLRELVPRSRPWAREALSVLAEQDTPTLCIPLLNEAPAIQVDGIPDESSWARTYFSRERRLRDVPCTGGTGAIFAIACSAGIYVRLETPWESQDQPRLSIALAPLAAIPVEDTPAYTLRLDRGNLESFTVIGQREAPFPDVFLAATSIAENRCTAEAWIPLDGLRGASLATSAIWRLNASILPSNEDGTLGSRWGHRELSRAYRGVIVEFVDVLGGN